MSETRLSACFPTPIWWYACMANSSTTQTRFWLRQQIGSIDALINSAEIKRQVESRWKIYCTVERMQQVLWYWRNYRTLRWFRRQVAPRDRAGTSPMGLPFAAIGQWLRRCWWWGVPVVLLLRFVLRCWYD